MTGIYETTDFRAVLNGCLNKRKTANPSYSLRAFARSLKVSPSFLNEVLSGEKMISHEMARSMSRTLCADADERNYFELLVRYAKARTANQKKELRKRIQSSKKFSKCAAAEFQNDFYWYEPAILNLADTTDSISLEQIVSRLNISNSQAKDAISKMLQYGGIKEVEPSKFARGCGDLKARTAIRSEAMDRFVEDMLRKAISGLNKSGPAATYSTSTSFAFDTEQREQVKELSLRFVAEIAELAKQGKNRTEVFHLGVQLFQVTEGT